MPSEIDDFDGDLVVTTEKEAPKQISIPILFDEIISKEPIVVKGIITKMLKSSTNSSKLILGIDPGERIGVSVTYLENEIARTFFVSMDRLIPYLISILAELPAARKIVKIGNGDMKTANKILQMLNLKFCSKFEIEFVDESNTTFKLKITINAENETCYLHNSFHKEVESQNTFFHFQLRVSTSPKTQRYLYIIPFFLKLIRF